MPKKIKLIQLINMSMMMIMMTTKFYKKNMNINFKNKMMKKKWKLQFKL